LRAVVDLSSGGPDFPANLSDRIYEPYAPLGLPAPVIVTTSCGRFRVGLAGGVVYLGPRTL
jgi:hypothetical protein